MAAPHTSIQRDRILMPLVALMLVGATGCGTAPSGGPTKQTDAAVSQPPRADFTLAGPTPDSAWDGFFTRTSGWTGGDIGASVDLGDGRTLWFFGDSWIGPVERGRHAEGTFMARNAMAVHPNPPRAPGGVEGPPELTSAVFMWSREGVGEAQRQWLGPAQAPRAFESPPDKTWYWPMGDAVVSRGPGGRERLVMFAIAVGPSGAKDGMWDFRTVGGVVAVVDNFHDDPRAWVISQIDNPLVVSDPRVDAPPQARARPTELWAAAAVHPVGGAANDGEWVYLFGTRDTGPGGRHLLMARAPITGVEQTSTWQFRTAEGWSSSAADAAPIAGGFPTEFTIRRLEIDGRGVWVAIHSEPMFGHHIQARTAHQPEGPWSAAKSIHLVPEVEADKRLITYAHKAHPHLSRSGELLVSYVVNSSDFGQVMGDASLYRPRFVRVPLGLLPKPPE